MDVNWLAETLPNLGVGVASIGAVGFITINFLKSMKEERREYRSSLDERELAFRTLEKEVRTSISQQLYNATHQLTENSKTMERVIDHLETHRNKN